MTKKLLLLLVAGLCASAFTLAFAKGPAKSGFAAKGARATEGHGISGRSAPLPAAPSAQPSAQTPARPPVRPSAELSKKPGTDHNGGPDGDGYLWKDTITYAWDANTGYTMSGYGDDGYFGPFTWSGWTFYYRGTNYSQIYISDNGYITFGTNTPSGGYGTTYPSSSNGATACGVLHGDLYCASGDGLIKVGAYGSAPNRYICISYDSVYAYGSSTYRYQCEILLKERDSSLTYQYKYAYSWSAYTRYIGCQNSGSPAWYGLPGDNSIFGYLANGYAVKFYHPPSLANDVGCTGIPGLVGDTGTYTPTATIHNYGSANQSSFNARFVATGPGATYDQTITGLHKAAGSGDTTVTFPSWHITVRGTWALQCSTQLSGDQQTSNDKYATTRVFPPSQTNVLRLASWTMNGPTGYGSYSMGIYFTPVVNGNITAIGRYRGSYSDPSTCKLWLVSNGTLLATATVTDTGWGCTAITPVAVTAGTQYCVSTYGGNDVYYPILTTIPQTVNNVRIDNGEYYYGDGMPTTNGGTYAYGAADICFAVVTHANDLACTGIPDPHGDVGTYTPTATIHNYGTSNATSFGAHYVAIGPGATYDQTISGLHLAAGGDTLVSFPSWTISVRGSWTLKCSTQLSGDEYTPNDKYTTLRSITPGTNVLKYVTGGTMNGPTSYGPYTMGFFFTPQSNGQIITLGRYRGSYANDTSVVKLWLVSTQSVIASAVVKGDTGWGSAVLSSPVSVTMGTQYAITTYGGVDVYYYYMPYVPYTVNGVRIDQGAYNTGGDLFPNTMSTTTIYGAPDMFFSNVVPLHDVGVSKICAPFGSMDSGTTVTPACSCMNFGRGHAESYTVRMKIGAAYNNTATVSAQDSGTVVYVTFPSWIASPKGNLAVTCSTEMNDSVPQDNKKTGSVKVNMVGAYKVLVVAAEAMTSYPILMSAIPDSSGGMLATADWFDPRSTDLRRPDSLLALGYKAMLVFGDYGFYNATDLGDTLARYMELGGGVVITPFGDEMIAGRYATQYMPIPVTSDAYGSMTLGTVYVPTHPIMAGVTTVTSGYYNGGSTTIAHPARTTRIADWNTGSYVQAAAYDSAGIRTAYLGFFPVQEIGYYLSGQWVRQLDNALLWVCPAPVHDVGATKINTPSGVVDSGTVVTPACSLFNYGNKVESYSARMKIGSLYNQTVAVTGHTAGSRILVTFPTWTAMPRGALAMSCSTMLANDTNRANDKKTGTIGVTVEDVGCKRLIAPTGNVIIGTNVTPACSVYNWGNQPATYTVRMKIGAGYNNTATVTGQGTGTEVYVTFPNWPATPLGTYVVSCSTQLSGDLAPANDKLTGSVTVCARAWVDSTWDWYSFRDDSVRPTFHVRNIDTRPDTFRCRVTDSLGWRVSPEFTTILNPGEDTLVNLKVVVPPGAAVGTRDRVTLTAFPVSDTPSRASGFMHILVVPTRRVDVAQIQSPAETVNVGTVITPSAVIRNTGDSAESVVVTCTVVPPDTSRHGLGPDTVNIFVDHNGNWQDTSSAFSNIHLDPGGAVNPPPPPFPDTLWEEIWAKTLMPPPFLIARYKCRSWCCDDGQALRQKFTGDCSTPFFYFEADIAQHYTHRLCFELTLYYWVNDTLLRSKVYMFHINSSVACGEGPGGQIYNNTTQAYLTAGQVANVTFPSWTAAVKGSYQVLVKADLPLRHYTSRNYELPQQLTVLQRSINTGWTQVTSVPSGPKSKNVKDGGCIAAYPNADTDMVYALKGNGRCEFYAYNAITNTWATPCSIPAIGSSGKKKAVKKGASMATLKGSGTQEVVATKGGGTDEFWRYDPSTNAWTAQPDVPMGAKAIKEGSGMAKVAIASTAGFYLLKGSGTQEFYRYNTLTNVWEIKAPAPTGLSGKPFKDGSCIAASEDGKTIYACKANYNEFYAYNVDSDKWTTLTPVPLIGTSGKKTKVKSGAAMAYHNHRVYLTKGNNTTEFWQYQADSGAAWSQLENCPLGSGKKWKGGGAMTYAPNANALFFLQGNNTPNFFEYGLGTTLGSGSGAPNANVESKSDLGVRNTELRIAPNPFSNATTISYSLPKAGNVSLKLYDVTGKLVTTLATGYHNSGASSFIVSRSALSSGIYLVKLETETTTTTTKLIIE